MIHFYTAPKNRKGEMIMPAQKKKKLLKYNGKPLIRVGNRLYYGELEDKLILVLDIEETAKINGVNAPSKVKILLMDNTGEFGNGQIFRKGEREDIRKALDIGEWWLQDALKMMV